MAERIGLGIAALAAAFLVAPAARADKDFFSIDGYQLTPGSTRYEAARQAAVSNAQIFGAVGAYNRHIVPLLTSGKDGALFELEYHATINAAKAPGSCPTKLGKDLDGCNLGTSINHLDLYGSNFAIAYRGGPLSLFYSASLTMPVVVGPGLNRGLLPYLTITGPVFAHAMVPMRLISKDFGKDILPGIGIDAIGGGGFVSDYITINGGYALSQGLFGDIQIPKLQGFATALLGDKFKDVVTFLAGIRQFDYFGLKEFTDTAGRTSLYARQLRYIPPQTAQPGDSSAATDQRDGAFNFISGHLEQTDIVGYFDVSLSYLTKPTPLLQEASVSIHTKGFRAHEAKIGEGENGLHAGLTLGLVTLPDLYDFGVEGGRRFRFGLEISDGIFYASVRSNDPQTLAMFPMAYNALDIWMGLKFIGRD